MIILIIMVRFEVCIGRSGDSFYSWTTVCNKCSSTLIKKEDQSTIFADLQYPIEMQKS